MRPSASAATVSAKGTSRSGGPELRDPEPHAYRDHARVSPRKLHDLLRLRRERDEAVPVGLAGVEEDDEHGAAALAREIEPEAVERREVETRGLHRGHLAARSRVAVGAAPGR